MKEVKFSEAWEALMEGKIIRSNNNWEYRFNKENKRIEMKKYKNPIDWLLYNFELTSDELLGLWIIPVDKPKKPEAPLFLEFSNEIKRRFGKSVEDVDFKTDSILKSLNEVVKCVRYLMEKD